MPLYLDFFFFNSSKKTFCKCSAYHYFCLSFTPHCFWRLHTPALPTLVGKSSNRTHKRRCLKKHHSSGAAASLLHRLVPCWSPRAELPLRKSQVIQKAPALFRLANSANFILKLWISPQSSMSGGRLLRNCALQSDFAFPAFLGCGDHRCAYRGSLLITCH